MKHVVLALWVGVTVAAALFAIARTGCEEPKPKRTPPQIAGATTHPSQLPNARGTFIASVLYWLPPTWQLESRTSDTMADGRIKQIRTGPEPDAPTLLAYKGTEADLADDARIYAWAGEFEGGESQINVWGSDDIRFGVGGCHVRLLRIAGTMHPLPPPTRPSAPVPAAVPAALPDWAMFIAIVTGGDAPVFFRVAGPNAAVEAERQELMAFFTSISKVKPPPGMKF